MLTIARIAGGRADVRLLLMAGVVVGAFANAVIMVAYATAPPETVRGALWWMMGSVDGAEWRRVSWLAVYVVIGGGALVVWARDLDALALGDDGAAALGVDVERASRRAYLAAALLAAATVAAAGLVGFVGLVVPHMVRAAGLRQYRALLCRRRGGRRRVWSSRPTSSPAPFARRPSCRWVRSRRSWACRSFSSSSAGWRVPVMTAATAATAAHVPGCACPLSGRDSGGGGRRDLCGAAWHRHGRHGSEWQRQEHARQGAPAPRADRAGQHRDRRRQRSGQISLRDAARRAAVVPQREDPAFPMTVREYIALGRFPYASVWRTTDPGGDRAVTAAIERAGVGGFLERHTDALSGGEWQRVRIARALAQGGQLLVLDEPTTFLDMGA